MRDAMVAPSDDISDECGYCVALENIGDQQGGDFLEGEGGDNDKRAHHALRLCLCLS